MIKRYLSLGVLPNGQKHIQIVLCPKCNQTGNFIRNPGNRIGLMCTCGTVDVTEFITENFSQDEIEQSVYLQGATANNYRDVMVSVKAIDEFLLAYKFKLNATGGGHTEVVHMDRLLEFLEVAPAIGRK